MVSAGDMVLGDDMALEGDTGLEWACLTQGLHHIVMLGHLQGRYLMEEQLIRELCHMVMPEHPWGQIPMVRR
jgi:hypothetical protein